MDLSVVVPCHNVEGYIDRCLAGLRDQDMGPEEYEIIIIDDGSTDGTLGIARKHEADDRRLTVHSQSNQGLSAARNAGLEQATGRYVYFVDGDDGVVRDSLPAVVAAMREYSLDVAHIGWRRVEPRERTFDCSSATHAVAVADVISGIEYIAEYLDYPTSVWSFLLDRSLLDRLGIRFEVGRFYEDQLFVAHVLAAAERSANVEQDVYRYTIRPGSITRDPSPERTKRLCADIEHVVLGLEELRGRTVATGTATPAFLHRLTTMQEGYVFLLMGRLIRSQVPLRPALPDALARMGAAGFYPLTSFPGGDRSHRGLHYRAITAIFNHRSLLYPLAWAYRAVGVARNRWPGRRAR